MDKAALIRANEAGFNARFSGASLKDNPYSKGSPEAMAWQAGWLQDLGGWVAAGSTQRYGL